MVTGPRNSRDLALRRLTPYGKGALRPQNRSPSRNRYIPFREHEQRSQIPFLRENWQGIYPAKEESP